MLLAFCASAFAQSEVAQDIGNLINQGKLKEAEQRDDYYLKKDPKNVDAIMMKGNIILNRYFAKLGQLTINVNQDESIYSTSIGNIGSVEDIVLPRKTVTEIANLWKRAVKIDDTRDDIHFGICQIYSMGLMVRHLIDYLPTLKRVIKDDQRLPYSMCDYARNMKERGDFKGAMEVYRAVMSLYPHVAGLRSDVAAEYYVHGDADSCMHYISMAIRYPNSDAMTYGNAFFFYSVFGEFTKALDAIKLQSKAAHNEKYLCYEGLLDYYENKPDWKKPLQEYAKVWQDTSTKTLADSLLSQWYTGSPANYNGLTALPVDDGYKILIHLKFMALEPDSFLPHFGYAELLTHSNQYAKAAAEYASMEKAGLVTNRSDSEDVAFYYGWTLWCLKEKTQSLKEWAQLLNSDDFYYKSAAAYFSGEYYLEKQDKSRARKFFELVSDKANQSKYATYCWNSLNSLK